MNDIEDLIELYGWNAFDFNDNILAKELLNYGHIKYEGVATIGNKGFIRCFEIYIHGSPRMANGWYQLVKCNGTPIILEPIPACTDHLEGRFEKDVISCYCRKKRQNRQMAL